MNAYRGELGQFPESPGVYLMRDALGQVIYVGKAKDLRARLRSYFRRGGDERPLIRYLMRDLAQAEVVVTGTEKEALILENNLIKRHRPKYNVRFRDDKDYIHIRIDTTHPFPRLSLARRPSKDGAMYFGPYDSAHAARQTLKLLQRHMGLRTCKDSQLRQAKRTCLNEQMGRCAGVCRGSISREEYGLRVQEAILFLRGRSKELIRQLRVRMREASMGLRFEEAARLRDQIQELERTVEAQRVDRPLGKDKDVMGLFRTGMDGVIAVLRVRGGKLQERISFPIPPTLLDDTEVMVSFLQQFYDSGRIPAQEILVPMALGEHAQALEQWLGELAGSRVRLRRPMRGEAKGLLEMAQENARVAPRDTQGWLATAQEVAKRLGLREPPRIMDALDISNLGGEEAVGSAVRFVEGTPEPSMYRTYRVRLAGQADDYAMMYEVIRRHLTRKREEGALPDLMVVDGGKGHLGVALAALEDLGISQVGVVALAKARGGGSGKDAEPERLFVPGRKDPIPLGQATASLRVLQHIRDEAHRFAITRHRKRRSLRRLNCALEEIPGVGPARTKALLTHLGSLRRVQEATLEQLATVPGISLGLARRIYFALHGDDGSAERDRGEHP
ncbi:MAG: excinuclease ABC subunit UvrC [Thermodesulfobacteriota bacterium]